jgi:hypothetical protein
MFNLMNHPNFGSPIGDLGSGLFGQVHRDESLAMEFCAGEAE